MASSLISNPRMDSHLFLMVEVSWISMPIVAISMPIHVVGVLRLYMYIHDF